MDTINKMNLKFSMLKKNLIFEGVEPVERDFKYDQSIFRNDQRLQ